MLVRLPLLSVFSLLVAGCQREPDFDARYKDQDTKLQSAANGMQAELSSRLSAAGAAQRNAIGDDENAPANQASLP